MGECRSADEIKGEIPSHSSFQRMEIGQTLNNSNTSASTADGHQSAPVIPPREAQFWILLIIEIPSLACTLFLLYHLLRDRRLRRALNNHVIIILLVLTLVIVLIDNPLYIDVNRLDGNHNSFTMVPSICLLWWLLEYGFFGSITVFLAWGSFERHILVFHQRQLLRTARQRFVIHYLPLILLSVYLAGFYVGVLLFPPCENTFDFDLAICGSSPCYGSVPSLNLWDNLFNGIICTFVEMTCSIGLLIRVFWQKRRVHQPMSWRKHRKMAFQLLSVSCLSLTIVFPQSSVAILRQLGNPTLAQLAIELDPYLSFLFTVDVTLLPFICLAGLSELWPKLRFQDRRPRGTVGPLTLLPNIGKRTVVQTQPS